MLSEIEVTYFRSRIEHVLEEERPTAWQRAFLSDMHEKIVRYGTRTRLTEKQLALLKKLTRVSASPGLQLIDFSSQRPRSQSRSYKRRSSLQYRDVRLVLFAAFFSLGLLGLIFQDAFDHLRVPAAALTGTSQPASSGSQPFTVTDGDTVRMSDGTPVRLVGFNTPEKFEPQCSREAELGHRASERLKQLVQSGQPALTKVACACKPGTEGTKQCNFGRSCGILKVDGQDVGQILISEGLAASFICSRTSCPRMPRPWCG